jgi:hypothetical protein
MDEIRIMSRIAEKKKEKEEKNIINNHQIPNPLAKYYSI